MLSSESRRVAGILLVVFPTVLYGGVSLLMFLLDRNSGYMENPCDRTFFAPATPTRGVAVLSLVALRYVDEANLSEGWKRYVRASLPSAAIFLPQHFSSLCFLPTPRNQRIHLPRLHGAVVLALGLLALGVGLLRNSRA